MVVGRRLRIIPISECRTHLPVSSGEGAEVPDWWVCSREGFGCWYSGERVGRQWSRGHWRGPCSVCLGNGHLTRILTRGEKEGVVGSLIYRSLNTSLGQRGKWRKLCISSCYHHRGGQETRASGEEVVVRWDAADKNWEPRTDLPCVPAAAALYRPWYLAPRTDILGWMPPFTNTAAVPSGVSPGARGRRGGGAWGKRAQTCLHKSWNDMARSTLALLSEPRGWGYTG